MKDNQVTLDGCYPDLVIDLSEWEFASFKYPLDPSPSGVIVFIESVKGFKGEFSGVRKLHGGLSSKGGLIESKMISASEDKVGAIKSATKKRKPV
jgi:hypothetical protein